MNNAMLSRVANAIYWMSRYVERAENTARFIDVNLQLTLDRTSGLGPQWMPLISITGDDDAFAAGYESATREHVLHFLTLDPSNPNSILSCINAARENARTVRETITTEMWEQVNELYHFVRATRRSDLDHRFYRHVKRTAMLFTAIVDNSQSRGPGWRFGRLGRMIERADKTSRILDVKYFLLLPSPEDVGTNLDVIQWRALLHSTDALEMYRQQQGTIAPDRVAGFLILDTNFPRSLAHCLKEAGALLDELIADDHRPATAELRRRLGRLQSELTYGTIDELLAAGLHEYLDSIQARLNAIDDAVATAFFRPSRPASTVEAPPVAAGSSSGS